MRNNTCEACGLPVLRRLRGEADRYITLDREPVSEKRLRNPLHRHRLRALDGGRAYLHDHMRDRLELARTPAERLSGVRRVDPLEDYLWHAEHQCGGR